MVQHTSALSSRAPPTLRVAAMTSRHHPICGAEQIHALIRSWLIDAVDLVDHVKRATGRKTGAEDFGSVHTVSDLPRAIERPSGA
jgi:hypothetical protein